MLRLVGIALALLGGLAGGYLLLAWLLQRSVMFPAPSAGRGDPLAAVPGAERLWLDTPGARVEAWYLPPLAGASGPAPLLLFTHGNGELIDDWAFAFDEPRRWGAAVLLVEYPGYGRSTGSPSQRSIVAAMTQAYDRMLTRPDVDAQRIVAYGRSLGGAAACALAGRRGVAALVLESSFTSVRSLARGFGLPGFMVRDPFDNLAVLRAYAGPVLIVHGEHDEIIPVAHASALQAAAPRSRLVIERCGHNDCPRPWLAVREFLLEHGLLDRVGGR